MTGWLPVTNFRQMPDIFAITEISCRQVPVLMAVSAKPHACFRQHDNVRTEAKGGGHTRQTSRNYF